MLYGLLNIFVWNVRTSSKNVFWTSLELRPHEKV
jgi:hypothetical protein